jgi:polysaccharide export outer membrane protein
VRVALACCLVQQILAPASAQELRPRVPVAVPGSAAPASSGAADGKGSPALTGNRRPLYRLRKSDVLEIGFTFAPEFNQTVTVQPDGFIPLKGLPDFYAEGQTLPELRQALASQYAQIMRDPEITLILKDFDKPYFVASGQVAHPGKYELRADTTVFEAVAMAGGFTEQAKHSHVLLFRRVSDQLLEARVLDLKHMLQVGRLGEDVHLNPGDVIYVPQNAISKIRRYLPASNLSLYTSPAQF